MRLPGRLILFVLTMVVFSVVAASGVHSESIRGPMLGFADDEAGTIRALMGITGAAVVGGPIDFGVETTKAVISPTQRYALVIRRDDGRANIISLDSESAAVREIAGLGSSADLIAISPTGSVSAVYDRGANRVFVIGAPPRSFDVIRELDTSNIPGDATDLAVSDDGAVALVRFADPESQEIWAVTSSGSRPIASGLSTAFFSNRHDAVVIEADGQTAALIQKVEQAAMR